MDRVEGGGPMRDTQEGGTHYREMGLQPWDVVDTWPLEQRIGFYRGNALKYLMRMGTKDDEGLEIRKARHVLTKLIAVLEEEVMSDVDDV